MQLTLAVGRADIIPESPLTVSGYKKEVDHTNWVTKEVVHGISDSGFTSQIRLETLHW